MKSRKICSNFHEKKMHFFPRSFYLISPRSVTIICTHVFQDRAKTVLFYVSSSKWSRGIVTKTIKKGKRKITLVETLTRVEIRVIETVIGSLGKLVHSWAYYSDHYRSLINQRTFFFNSSENLLSNLKR